MRGRILPNYATIDRDERIPFWRAVGEAVHRHDCKFIVQLSHSGRQQDVGGVENLGLKALSSTSKTESFHGFECRAMTTEEIHAVVQRFADGARRAREAGLDGVELHAANGYLITQFLSSAINDRKDEYGGSLENRARLLVEIITAIRREVGADFHLQAKISAVDHGNAIFPWEKKGNTLADSIEICRMAERAGADAIVVSSGNMFPHPRNPAGGLPVDVARETYDTMLSSGLYTFRNYLLARWAPLRPVFRFLWNRSVRGIDPEGANLAEARAIKERVSIPVLCTGGFQTASVIRDAITGGACDGGDDRAAAHREQRPRAAVRRRARPARAAVHLLQPLPGERHREPARVLRAAALRQPGGDDRRGHGDVLTLPARGRPGWRSRRRLGQARPAPSKSASVASPHASMSRPPPSAAAACSAAATPIGPSSAEVT